MSREHENLWTQQNPNPLPAREAPKAPETVEYICGECGARTAMKTSETIRCKECGHRVMYKPRTHRIVRLPIKSGGAGHSFRCSIRGEIVCRSLYVQKREGKVP